MPEPDQYTHLARGALLRVKPRERGIHYTYVRYLKPCPKDDTRIIGQRVIKGHKVDPVNTSYAKDAIDPTYGQIAVRTSGRRKRIHDPHAAAHALFKGG